jgi:hypothetical protein
VTVTINKPTTLLSLIGIGNVHATKTATADLLQGVEGESRGFANSEGLVDVKPGVVTSGG